MTVVSLSYGYRPYSTVLSWLSHVLYLLLEMKLTAQRWHMVIDNPMVSGPDPLSTGRLESHVENTVRTRTKEMMNSTRNVDSICSASTVDGNVKPSLSLIPGGETRSSRPAPTTAPAVCDTTYSVPLK